MAELATISLAEPVQIGLCEDAHSKLERLHSEKHFAEMRDGYRFAVAYALASDSNAPKPAGARRNVYSISTLDPDGLLKLAVEALRPDRDEPVYRIVERLADWGIIEIDRLIHEEFMSIADILRKY